MINLFDKVEHVKDGSVKGIVVHVDDNLKGTTTCRVAWGVETQEEAEKMPVEDTDIQWTNKLIKCD